MIPHTPPHIYYILVVPLPFDFARRLFTFICTPAVTSFTLLRLPHTHLTAPDVTHIPHTSTRSPHAARSPVVHGPFTFYGSFTTRSCRTLLPVTFVRFLDTPPTLRSLILILPVFLVPRLTLFYGVPRWISFDYVCLRTTLFPHSGRRCYDFVVVPIVTLQFTRFVIHLLHSPHFPLPHHTRCWYICLRYLHTFRFPVPF